MSSSMNDQYGTTIDSSPGPAYFDNTATSKNTRTTLPFHEFKRLIKYILIALMIVFLAISTSTTSYWMLFGPKTPKFAVKTMSMSVIHNHPESWYMELTIRNTNKKIGMTCEGLNGTLFYYDEYSVSEASLYPKGRLHIPMNGQVSLGVKFPAHVKNWDAQLIMSERADYERIDLVLNMVGYFSYKGWHISQRIKVVCGTLSILFNTTPSGLLRDSPIDCTVSV